MEDLKHQIRMQATANVFQTMGTEGSGAKVIEQFKSMPDELLDILGTNAGIKKEHLPIYRKLTRGEKNDFTEKLQNFRDELKTGDIILVTGTSNSSKVLAKLQKTVYSKARSSHVVIVLADFICIDAMPNIGVSLKLIHEVLNDVQEGWRIIRFKGLQEKDSDVLSKTCAYYIEQPYIILPKKKPAKKFSYCSELARKVYLDSKIKNTGIPNNTIIKPCDFDKIADQNSQWLDVTDSVKPYVEFCIEYEGVLKFIAKSFTQGIELNRQRFSERRKVRENVSKMHKKGVITDSGAAQIKNKIELLEKSLNYKFWDYQ
ncbi:hypothetical protein Q4567_21700 [Aliiglaciecola sp. 2_MG-2023]|uniref:hypothetical protein n=1 Tax=unclassified Aliiglaciecola TaxID=2593648 RepID=UPI0026E1BF2E|nr:MULTISPECIES: hypothetical protein [unclassified Aliiglaciecola]MDO6713356.1 hypothetical protein [Aliiglaciecola sp. 2_MG-2023]MDO6754488.1 hypothetical protein [Aliiglaciecola sp. 1_MG-2023]